MVKSNEKASSSFVKKSNAFIKKKLKMGKFLHRENATNTNFKSKQIILPHQVKLSQEVDNKTRPKESINDLCQMLTHQNEKFCKSALSGIRGIIENNQELLHESLAFIINSLGTLFTTRKLQPSTYCQLRVLMDLIFSVNQELIKFHFSLVIAYIFSGITNIAREVSQFSFEVLILLLKKQRGICRCQKEIFFPFLHALRNGKGPSSKEKLLECLDLFITVYAHGEEITCWPTIHAKLSMEKRTTDKTVISPLPSAIYFPVCSDINVCGGSFLNNGLNIIELCTTFTDALLALKSDDAFSSDARKKFDSIITKLCNVILQSKEENCLTASHIESLKTNFFSKLSNLTIFKSLIDLLGTLSVQPSFC